jgi:sodium transport system ATP-binding protein
MIEVQQVAKAFTQGRWRKTTSIQAVSQVTFTAKDGCITGLLGPNGAGKTTTLRMVASIIQPDSGQVLIDGLSAHQRPQQALARLGILSDARGLYPRLTALENIVYFGQLQGLTQGQAMARAKHLAQVLDMTDLMERRTQGFSQGERMKTALARALVHDPQNIILDEPTNGLDVLATRALRDTLRRLRDHEGKCIVFSTHVMQEVERMCDHVTIIAQGRNMAEGTVQALKEQTAEPDFENSFVKLAFAQQAWQDHPTQEAQT